MNRTFKLYPVNYRPVIMTIIIPIIITIYHDTCSWGPHYKSLLFKREDKLLLLGKYLVKFGYERMGRI